MKNDVTGDKEKYSEVWDMIFGKQPKPEPKVYSTEGVLKACEAYLVCHKGDGGDGEGDRVNHLKYLCEVGLRNDRDSVMLNPEDIKVLEGYL